MTPLGELNRMHQFRDKSAAQRELVSAGLLFYPVLLAADVLAYRAHEVPVGEDQREHVELMRDVAERFNRRFGETLVVPEIRVPEVGARIGDLQEPERKMSTTGRSEPGTVYVLDEPDAIVKKFKRAVTDSGTEIVRGGGQAGRLEPARHLRGGARHERARRSAAFADARGTGTSRSRWPRRSSSTSRRCASATPRCAPTRPRSRRSSRRRREGPRDRRRHARRRARADGRRARFRRPGGLASRRTCPPSPSNLELDLDVFAGPFDLLLSLILREELDLLEVDLADIVITYVDHLEAREELDLEATTEFLVLIAALLELKSRLMLPGEEIDELDELLPGRGGRGAAGPDARLRALPRRRGVGARALRGLAEASCSARRRCPPSCGGCRRAGRRRSRPVPLGAALGGLLRHPPPLDLSHMATPRVSLPSASACCARCCGAAPSTSRRPSAAPTA